jgi:citronellol/citronellal dehydrogenase
MTSKILVTGASRGIGLEIASVLADQQQALALSARGAEVEQRATELAKVSKETVVGLRADLGRPDDAIALADRAAEQLGGLDSLVLNAGLVRTSSLAETSNADIAALFDVNVTATMLLVKAALPWLRKSQNARIVVLAPPPTSNKRWLGAFAPYAVSKLSLSLAVVGLAEELKRYGIAVNGLWPHTLILTDAITHAHNVQAENCRTPRIVADAVSALLALPPRSENGRFFLDEEILRSRGVSDFSHYAVEPGKPLASDTFISQEQAS